MTSRASVVAIELKFDVVAAESPMLTIFRYISMFSKSKYDSVRTTRIQKQWL